MTLDPLCRSCAPPASEALLMAAVFAVALFVVGWIVRPLLRDRRYPRWLAIAVTVSAPAVANVFMRYVVSWREYRAPLREGAWVFLWCLVGCIAFLAALFAGGGIRALEEPRPAPPQGDNPGGTP